jgi:hypothetical protein
VAVIRDFSHLPPHVKRIVSAAMIERDDNVERIAGNLIAAVTVLFAHWGEMDTVAYRSYRAAMVQALEDCRHVAESDDPMKALTKTMDEQRRRVTLALSNGRKGH